MSEVIFTDQNWESEVLNSDLPVIVDFWASWCAPCYMIAPMVEEIGQKYEEKIRVGKLNVDENPAVAGKYGIMSIPTLLFFQDGKIADRVIGVVPKEVLEQKVEKLLKEES